MSGAVEDGIGGARPDEGPVFGAVEDGIGGACPGEGPVSGAVEATLLKVNALLHVDSPPLTILKLGRGGGSGEMESQYSLLRCFLGGGGVLLSEEPK